MKRILVVDDDPASCAATIGILEALECAVEIVPDAGTALKRLRRRVPDAVLVSVNIPAMAGGDFVRACQADPRCSHVPVVAALQPLLWERAERDPVG